MRRFRLRSRGLGLGCAFTAIAVGLVFGATPATVASAATESAGFGHAAAQTLQLDPRTAGLSYSATFGATIADHINAVARSQAQMINFGVIGTALTTPGCEGGDPYIDGDQLPKPTRVDSRDPGAEDGKTTTNGPFEEFARATARPYAESYSKIAPLDLAGVVTFLGGKATSTSGIDSASAKQASAQVDVSGISLVNGLVELRGLHWRSSSQIDKKDPSSAFSIDSVTIAGQTTKGGNALKAIERANIVLKPLGILIGVPKVHTANDTTFVDPLRIGIVPSEQRDALPAAVLSGIQPVREAVFQYLLDNTPCDYSPAALILVADIFTLAATGGGSMNLNIGGTQAQAKKITQAAGYDFDQRIPSVPAATVSGDVALPPTGVGDYVTITDGATNQPTTRRALPATATDDESDNAIWVAIAVIGLGLALVEGEVRLRRRSAAGAAS